jgi:putative CRISPR-associated protein (TIGR02619 family)
VKKKSILCLVGTSVLSNSLRDKNNCFYTEITSLLTMRNDRELLNSFSKSQEEQLNIVRFLYKDAAVKNSLTNWLVKSIESAPEKISAEVNTIKNYLKECGELCEPHSVHLINTTTEEGTLCRDALKIFFEKEFSVIVKNHPLIDTTLPIQDSGSYIKREIEDLRDKLIKIILDEFKEGNEVVYISSSGLKPHITTATIVSNIMGCKIFYQFERSDKVQRIDSEWFDYDIFVKKINEFLKEGEIETADNLIRLLPKKLRINVVDDYYRGMRMGIVLKKSGIRYLLRKMVAPIGVNILVIVIAVFIDNMANYGISSLSLNNMILLIIILGIISYTIQTKISESEIN